MHDFIKSSVTLNWNRKPLYKNTEFHGFRMYIAQGFVAANNEIERGMFSLQGSNGDLERIVAPIFLN